MVHPDNPVIEFTAHDRCDSCGAQAYVQASKDGYDLLFCAHHFGKHDNALDAEGWSIAIDFAGLEELQGVRV